VVPFKNCAVVNETVTGAPPLGFFLVLRSLTVTLCFLVLTDALVFIGTPEFLGLVTGQNTALPSIGDAWRRLVVADRRNLGAAIGILLRLEVFQRDALFLGTDGFFCFHTNSGFFGFELISKL